MAILSTADERRIRLVVLTEAGIFLALSLALSQVRLFTLPNGGTVSLSPFPVMLLSARRGWRTGMAAGFLLGVLVMALGPVIVHPLQGALDYPLAHAALGLAGLIGWETMRRAWASVILAGAVKLVLHSAAGWFFLAGKGMPLLQLAQISFLYNLTHQGPEIVICCALAGFLVRGHPETAKNQAGT